MRQLTRQARYAALALAGLTLVLVGLLLAAGGRYGRVSAAASKPAPTAEQKAAAAQLIADLKVAMTRYASPAAAQAEGYMQTTPYRFLTWGPAHFNNYTYARDDRLLDPSRPEGLVYIKLQSGETGLMGVMFVAPQGKGPRPAGPLTEWHTHANLCLTSTGSVALSIAPGVCPPGAFFVGEAVEMMHIWLFDHPDGPFAHDLTPASIRAAARQLGGR